MRDIARAVTVRREGGVKVPAVERSGKVPAAGVPMLAIKTA